MPPKVQWPRNLFIIGTVNVDESTHLFSDKVLDRAMTMEFWEVDVEAFVERFLSGEEAWDGTLVGNLATVLQAILQPLQKVRQHFGYRTMEELIRYVHAYLDATGASDYSLALDQAVLMKVLPRLRGESTRLLHEVLAELERVLLDANLVQSSERVLQMREQLASGTMRFWR